MKAFVITVDPDGPRMRRLERAAHRWGYHVKTVPGVIGRTVPETVLEQSFAPGYVRHARRKNAASFLAGTYGCFCGHISAWEQLLATPDLPAAVILEDDAFPLAAFPDTLAARAATDRLVYLNRRMVRTVPEALAGHGAIVEPPALTRIGTGGDAYLIGREAARRFLAEVALPWPTGVDGFLLSYIWPQRQDDFEHPPFRSLKPWIARREALDPPVAVSVGVYDSMLFGMDDEGRSYINTSQEVQA